MTTPYQVAVVVGSLRKDSVNKKVAQSLIKLNHPNLQLKIVTLNDLTLYNQDIEDTPPQSWVDFRNEIAPCQGVIFCTPEYNHSIPGVLKNAVDIGSRPPGKGVWTNKPAAIISASPGRLGGSFSVQHLRLSLVASNMPVMPQPELYLSDAYHLFDADGNMLATETPFAQNFLDAFAAWIAKFN